MDYPEMVTCPECDGDGYIQEECQECDGGYDPPKNEDGEEDSCDECQGAGVVDEDCQRCEGVGEVEK